MRIAIASDLHGNLPAWKAVLLDLASLQADQVICLGDAVGYGPDPAGVLQSIHEHVDHFILGNHEAALCGRMDPSLFDEGAQALLTWTRSRLKPEAIAWMEQWPLALAAPGFRCAHGDHAHPAWFEYVFEADDALASWQTTTEPLLFTGHTHIPGVFVLGASGQPHRLDPQDFELEDGKRYLVNPGSVGQPRDGDVRAAYVLYDVEHRSIHFRRVPYDLDAFRAAVESQDLPEAARRALFADPLEHRPALRPHLDFRPATADAEAAQGATTVRVVEHLEARARGWRRATLGLTATLLCLAATAGWAVLRRADPGRDIPAARAPATTYVAPNRLPWPDRSIPAGSPLPGWTVQLGHAGNQSVAVERDPDGAIILRARSARPDERMMLRSTPISVQAGERFSIEACFVPADDFAGVLAVAVEAGRAGEPLREIAIKEPSVRRKEGRLVLHTFTTPPGTTSLRIALRGQFKGTMCIRRITLIPK